MNTRKLNVNLRKFLTKSSRVLPHNNHHINAMCFPFLTLKHFPTEIPKFPIWEIPPPLRTTGLNKKINSMYIQLSSNRYTPTALVGTFTASNAVHVAYI